MSESLETPSSGGIRYEATVVTGLEGIAMDDCKEKLKTTKVTRDLGRVYIDGDVAVKDVLALRCVDNVYVVIYDLKHEVLPQDETELSTKLEEIVQQCDWKNGLDVWKEAYNLSQFDTELVISGGGDKAETCLPSFRVTCNRVGKAHKFQSPQSAATFGGLINTRFNWPVKMKDYDMEVVLNIKEKRFYVTIAITTESLHKRNLVSFGSTSLRATIAYNMLRVACIQPGEVVCDGMCGSGAIPIECAIEWPSSYILAGDNYPPAVERTKENFDALNKPLSLFNILHLDVKSMPFRDNSIDVFVMDLPFGKRLGTKYDNKVLYPGLLRECARCVPLNTGRVVMLTQDKRSMNLTFALYDIKKYWTLIKAVFVKIGGLEASIYCVKRTSYPIIKAINL